MSNPLVRPDPSKLTKGTREYIERLERENDNLRKITDPIHADAETAKVTMHVGAGGKVALDERAWIEYELHGGEKVTVQLYKGALRIFGDGMILIRPGGANMVTVHGVSKALTAEHIYDAT